MENLTKEELLEIVRKKEEELKILRAFHSEHTCKLCSEFIANTYDNQCENCGISTCDECGLFGLGYKGRWLCKKCAVCKDCSIDLTQNYIDSKPCGNCQDPLCEKCSTLKITCKCGKSRTSCKTCLNLCSTQTFV